MKLHNKIGIVVFLTLIDFVLMKIWVSDMHPDPSVSIGLVLLIPFVIGINLVIALILRFFKREFVMFFIINAIISTFLIDYVFNEGIRAYQRNRLESWKFDIAEKQYRIMHWKSEGTFSMSESENSGSSIEFLEGKFIATGNAYDLVTDSTKYVIRDEFLYGFKGANTRIKLKKMVD